MEKQIFSFKRRTSVVVIYEALASEKSELQFLQTVKAEKKKRVLMNKSCFSM